MNGSGHNPVIIANDANLSEAVDAIISLKTYNSGQDCANPNSILVDSRIFTNFVTLLKSRLACVKVGLYGDEEVIIGPLHNHR